MVLRKLRFASSRFSAGDETWSASVLCERPDRPRVKSVGRAAIVGTGYAGSAKDRQIAAVVRSRGRGAGVVGSQMRVAARERSLGLDGPSM